jgi:hypothetical protein
MDTFSAQLQEYMTSVNNNANYGLDNRLPPIMKTLHSKVDKLIESIDNMKSEALEFQEKYKQQLEDKDKFYKNQDKAEREQSKSKKDKVPEK